MELTDRQEQAIYLYQTEQITLAKAAELAGMSFFCMKDLLFELGVPLRISPETWEEVQEELQTVKRWFPANPR